MTTRANSLHQWYSNDAEDYDNPHQVDIDEQDDTARFIVPRGLNHYERAMLERALHLADDLRHAREMPLLEEPADVPRIRFIGVDIRFGDDVVDAESYEAERIGDWPERPDRITVKAQLDHADGTTEKRRYPTDVAFGKTSRMEAPVALVTKESAADVDEITDILIRAYGDTKPTLSELAEIPRKARGMAMIALHGRNGRLWALRDLAEDILVDAVPERARDIGPVTIELFGENAPLAAAVTDY